MYALMWSNLEKQQSAWYHAGIMQAFTSLAADPVSDPVQTLPHHPSYDCHLTSRSWWPLPPISLVAPHCA